MGSKKKEAQAARREARKQGKAYREQFMSRLSIFNDCLKPKPKFMPKWLWFHWSHTVVDLTELERRLNGK